MQSKQGRQPAASLIHPTHPEVGAFDLGKLDSCNAENTPQITNNLWRPQGTRNAQASEQASKTSRVSILIHLSLARMLPRYILGVSQVAPT